MKPKHKTSDSELMKALGFTEDDLEMNREGYVTKSQWFRLIRRYLQNIVLIIYNIIFVLCFAIGVIITGLFREDYFKWIYLLSSIILALVSINLIVLLWDFSKEGWIELRKRLISVVESPVNKKKKWTNSGIKYWLEVNDKTFEVNNRVWHLINENSIYYIYFMLNTLLAIEPVDATAH